MQVDEDRYKKVIEALDDFAAVGTKYTFDEFCKEKQLYSERDRHRLNDVFIACPFHKEVKPSLSLDEAHRRWKCFGCQCGGKYIDFITKYDVEILGIKTNRAKKINELLHNDSALRAKVGFDTIFRKEQSFTTEEVSLPFKKFKIQSQHVSSYLELATKIQQKHYDLQIVKYAITLMQSGIAPDVIEYQLATFTSSKSKTAYSLESLDREE